MNQCAECDEKVAAEILKDKIRANIEATAARFLRSGLPESYRSLSRTWDAVAAEIADPIAFDLLTTESARGLYLWGPAGAFKTSAAATYLAKAIREGRDGRYVYVPSMFSELFAIYSANDGRSRADIVDRYGYTDCLVLDDLGKEKPGEHGAAVINEILDIRYRRRRGWTVITSNYSIDVLTERLTAAAGEEWAAPIARRILEMCVMLPMELRS